MNRKFKFGVAPILAGLPANTVGTRVLSKELIRQCLIRAITDHDPNTDRKPGQRFLKMQDEAVSFVDCGIARRSPDPKDYHVRFYRGRVRLFGKRDLADDPSNLAIIVYSWDAYIEDRKDHPEDIRGVTPMTEEDRGTVHFSDVVVAVLAGDKDCPGVVSPERLVSNLAGGNAEYDLLTLAAAPLEGKNFARDEYNRLYLEELKEQVHWLTEMADKVNKQDETWIVVADEEDS